MSTAHELQEQGVKLFQQKDFEAAARLFQQARDGYTADGQSDMAAEMQVNIGLVHRTLGENQQALDMMQAALVTFQEMQDALRTAQVFGNIGGVYVALGDKEQAYNCYRQAADIFEELGQQKLYGETMLAMADLQVRDGKFFSGAATYEVGLEQLDELSASQKVIKGLLGIRNKLSGGGKPK
ncbi:MAG: tetratricopeptide repeat protein [Anaerolineaceae bacterium]|nr:tetratricopeptide repeat protein [Anaerolineaceae bacterium]